MRVAFADQFVLYNPTTRGIPITDSKSIFDVSSWVSVGQSRGMPEDRRMTIEIKRATGWSDRTIALALGTSHPTVAKLLNGDRTSLRVRRHLRDAYEVVRRVSILNASDPAATDRVLQTEPGSGRSTPLEMLRNGEFSSAYLVALDAMRPRREGLMRGTRPASIGRATAALFDEE